MKGYYSGKRQLKEDIAGYLFISPWFIGFFAFAIFPILMSLRFSFTDYDILGSPIFNGIDNFRRMMTDTRFWKSIQVTFTYAFTAVPLRLVFAFFLAALFKRASRMIRVYQAVYYLPSLVGGSIAIAVIWRRMFTIDGLFNSFLQAIGINSNISWIGSASTALGCGNLDLPCLFFLRASGRFPKPTMRQRQLTAQAGSASFSVLPCRK
jgi:multiple sugar transport system permease protein